MPTKPTIQKLDATSPQILNAVRNELGAEFSDRVPQAINIGDEIDTGKFDSHGNSIMRAATSADSVSSLREIGNVVMSYQPLQNAFLSALVNRIGRVIITSKLYDNPWSFFKKGLLEFGETVEEIFVNIAQPHEFNPSTAENEIFKREIPNVLATFHTMNFQKFYKATVSNDQLRQAFLGWSGITDLIGRIIDSLYTGANYDEFITMKYLVSRALLNGQFANYTIPTISSATAEEIVTTIKGASDKLTFLNSQFNYANVETLTEKSDQYLIMSSDFNAIVDVSVLAKAFNEDRVQFMGRTVLVDTFAPSSKEMERLAELFKDDARYVPFTDEQRQQLATVGSVLVDRDWFMIFDNFYNMTENYNGEGLYWNYWYHVWKTFSTSPYANAISFGSTAPTFTSITMVPTTVTVAKGVTTQIKLNAIIVSSGFASKKLLWTISANTNSSVTPDGLVTIGESETETTITVTATSEFDSTKNATCVITVA